MDEDQKKAIGCWAGIVLLAVLGIAFGIAGRFTDTDTVIANITVDISESTVSQLENRGRACDLSNYTLEVFGGDTNGPLVGDYALEGGWFPDPRLCRYVVQGEIEKYETYAIKLRTFDGDPTIESMLIDFDNVVTRNSDGTEVLNIAIQLVHQKDIE